MFHYMHNGIMHLGFSSSLYVSYKVVTSIHAVLVMVHILENAFRNNVPLPFWIKRGSTWVEA